MKISNIKIRNFKSVRTANIYPSDFNINVGQNNHGKSNFFEAIRWFFDGLNRGEEIQDIKCALSEVDDPIEVEITFTGIQTKIKDSDSTKAKAIRTKLGDLDTITVRRSTNSEDFKRREFLNPNTKKWENPIGADNAWNEFLPIFQYIKTELCLEDINSYKTNSPIGEMLSGLLKVIIEKDPEYENFRKQFVKLFEDENSQIRIELDKLGSAVGGFLQKQFPNGTTIKFTVDNPQFEELLKNFQTEVDDGIRTKVKEKGDGMQRAVMLAIIQAYANYRRKENLTNNFIFLIDEAELHLHPSAQRALKSALLDIALHEDQVFINTHSSVLVADGHEKQTILVTTKIDGVTNINLISDTEKPVVIFDLLGGSPSDLLLPSNILIVEGYSDATFLRGVIQRFYSKLYSNIQIAPANGDIAKQDKSIKFIENAYECFNSKLNPYVNKVVVLVDAPTTDDKKKKYEEFKDSYKELISSGRLFELPVGSVEEYYPDAYRVNPNTLAGKINGKLEYAKEVASKITKEEFEKDMQIFNKALQKAYTLSFGII